MAAEPRAQPVLMRIISFLPASTQGRAQTPKQKAEAQETGIYCPQIERIAHDLKNCMSVLLLAITGLKDNQPLIAASRNQALEEIVIEMDRLVDELVTLTGRRVGK